LTETGRLANDGPAAAGHPLAVPDPGRDVAVYVHWPYCARICPYCDFNVVRDRGQVETQLRLVDAIMADLEAQASRLGSRDLTSIFFGGGTPSLMAPDAVARMIDRIRQLFVARGPIEVTLEANPTDAEADRFQALARAGVNRLSLGVQSLDDQALRFLGRNHSSDEARRAIRLAASAFRRLSIDLIYALPGQSAEAWSRELETAIGLGFEHISPYQLTIEPTTAFGRAFARGSLVPPGDDLAADLYETTQAVLEGAGFETYEISNHARGLSARSHHNLHVWRGGDYLGVGPGAHGRLTLDGTRTATIAHLNISAYLDGVAAGTPWCDVEQMDDAAAAEERLLLGLRTHEGASLAGLESLGLEDRIDILVEEGVLQRLGGRLVATPKGRPVLDSVLRHILT